jgi:hypothetical protein
MTFVNIFKKLIYRYGLLGFIRRVLMAGIALLIIVIILELAIPLHVEQLDWEFSAGNDIGTTSETPGLLMQENSDYSKLNEVLKSGLFRAPTPLSDKPMTDKTIERIKSQLKLQCIMDINNELSAYINIQGLGLKKCRVGDTIHDLFTVLNINKKSVEISIVNHKVTLYL